MCSSDLDVQLKSASSLSKLGNENKQVWSDSASANLKIKHKMVADYKRDCAKEINYLQTPRAFLMSREAATTSDKEQSNKVNNWALEYSH